MQTRIPSIDIMRGLVILLMMLDHVRERFYQHVRVGDPIYDTIDADLFFTRLATHLCAPVFIFLAGLSTWLYAHPSKGVHRAPSGFLLKRGLVIILIEIVFYRLVWMDSYPSFLFLQVLFAIGAAMIALAAVCRLPYGLLAFLGVLIVAGHNALEPIGFARGDLAYPIWTVLHDPGEVFEVGGLTVSLSYPVLPWLGVIILGYVCGPLFSPAVSRSQRSRALALGGTVGLTLLLVLRGFNLYGETQPFSPGATALESLMSFVNFTKYPPSLDYLLLTLGVGALLLAWLEAIDTRARPLRAIETFGSVPMFLYVVHLYVLLGAYWGLYWLVGPTQGERFGLSSVGQIWLGAALLIAVHYPLALAFASYKHREKSRQPWLSYF